jgi:pyrimidine-nucleoside phosphorylase
MMNPVEIIIKKRDGHELSPDELRAFVHGYAKGEVPDYQAAAWAMAVYFQGMTDAETTALTVTMAESGDQLDLHDSVTPGTLIVDKHSSGGVGDKTTLTLGAVVAACGLPVGKMSGRGLSYTGGTIDKLESIPGWSPDLSEAQFRQQLREVGLVIAGQTVTLAPADKALYALRDVTGTVPSMPLIASSIMSKKLAAGADAIVLDVKCGRGAFMQNQKDAHTLAQLMVNIGASVGRRMCAYITQMEQPLGHAVGHVLEVKEAVAALQGEGPADFIELVETLSVEMLVLGAPATTPLHAEEARAKVKQVIASGAAFDKFRAFVAAQGGDTRVIDDLSKLPLAPVQLPVAAQAEGWVAQVAPQEVGLTVVDLGGGRSKKGDSIDYRVGVVVHAKVGAAVKAGTPLFTLHAASEEDARRAAARLQAAVQIVPQPVERLPMVYERVLPTSLSVRGR